jgi:hypothetical protein
MRKMTFFMFLLVLVFFGRTVSGQETLEQLADNSMAFVFHTRPTLLSSGGAAFDSGVGLKFWFSEKVAARAEIDFHYTNDSGTTDTSFGGSTAVEYHFIRKSGASAYTGGIAVLHLTGGGANNFSLSVGPILGVEFPLNEMVHVYVEDHLLFIVDEPVFEINLGVGDSAQIGLLVYIK